MHSAFLGCCSVVTLTMAIVPTVVAAPLAKPNVLLIAIDDLGTTLGCYGDGRAKTPHIDALARRGTPFLRAYCQFPLCNPSRASMLTGLRPDRVGVHDLPTHFRETTPSAITLPQYFREHGYYTARAGKVFHAGVPVHIGLNGLDDAPSWDERVNPRGRDKDEEAQLINLTPGRGPGVAIRLLAAEGDDSEQTDGKVVTETIRFLERAQERGQPFFVAAGFYRPHVPFVAPKAYFDWYPLETIAAPNDPGDELAQVPPVALRMSPLFWGLSLEGRRRTIQAYYASVSFVDAQVGRLLAALKRLGVADNTIVVLWSDHGYLLGQHGQWHKESLFEPALKAPMIIAPAGGKGTVPCDRLVEFVDLYPTLIELAGLPSRREIDGRSLVPLLQAPQQEWPHAAFSQVWNGKAYGRSIRVERYRYSEWGKNGAEGVQLYDFESDPEERRNVAGWPEYAAIRAQLSEQLHRALPWVNGVPPPRANAKPE
jgi:iduronate 2-sulfatase